jgi:ABC-type sugar transport system ATPase subunit
MTSPVLTIRDAVVCYGETTAVDGVSLAFNAGEIHALIGENGAGKSTLLRVLAGASSLKGGAIETARALRIEWVPQELALVPDLNVAEAIHLGRERRGRCHLLQRRAMAAEARTALATVGCRIAPTAHVGDLSPPQRKQVQLARAFLQAADVVLLDEPTAVLGQEDSAQLFAAMRAARDRGAAVIYVSHQIDEVLRIADRISVLRDGRLISTSPVRDLDEATIVTRMVGRPIAPPQPRVRPDRPATVRVRLANYTNEVLRGVSFDVMAGEIVGLAGLLGSGRSAALHAIAAAAAHPHPAITVLGKATLVPEDRLRNGLIPTLSLHENLFLPAPSLRLVPRSERAEALQWITRLNIRTRGPRDLPDALSGGNQQKLLLARALRQQPDVLLLDEPTAGVDVGAKAEIHAIIRAHAEAGAAVLIASSELPELLALSDRIVAMHAGRATLVERAGVAQEHVAALITGSRAFRGAMRNSRGLVTSRSPGS